MSEETIATIQEDIAKDIYEIAAFYKEEINRIMQEFDKMMSILRSSWTILKPKE